MWLTMAGVGFPSLASEFPNDNSEISGGAIWVCESLTGPATLEVQPYTPVESVPFVLMFDDDEDGVVDGPIEIELAPESGDVEVHVALASESESDTDTEVETEAEVAPAFAHFESALVTALLAQGATRSAALLPRLLRLEPLPADGLAKDVQLTLQSRGYLESNARYSSKYRELCAAWTAVLRGESQDFAACGTTTLDRFGADLVAALLAVPATRADELRRALRKAGIAAFGVLQAA
jgi:hypothetical protein